MAGVRDSQIVKAGPWPLGINNLAEEGALPQNEFGTRAVALREADNVDTTSQGRQRRRSGYVRRVEGALTHSLWGHDDLGYGLFVDGGALHVLHSDTRVESLGVSVGDLPLSYTLINDRVYYSNDSVCGMITPDMQAWSWAPECPTGQPTCVPVEGYALDAGLYQVAVTFTDLLGRESGAVLPTQVDVAQDGGIELSNIPIPVDPAASPTTNIYVSGANDQVLRLYASVPSMTTYGLISARGEGRTLLTQMLAPLPSGSIVRGGHGRQWVARRNDMYWSEPLRYGMYNPGRNRMRFNARITMLEPLGEGTGAAGVFVSAGEKVYWYDGADPAQFRQAVVNSHGAVPGSALRLPGSAFGLDSTAPTIVWIGTDGTHYMGQAGGSVTALTHGVVIDEAERAAVIRREQNGLSQFIAALRAPRRQQMAVTDRAYAHVVHRDVGL